MSVWSERNRHHIDDIDAEGLVWEVEAAAKKIHSVVACYNGNSSSLVWLIPPSRSFCLDLDLDYWLHITPCKMNYVTE